MHKATLYSKLNVIDRGLTCGFHQKITEDTSFDYLYIAVRAIEGPVWEKQMIETLQKG